MWIVSATNEDPAEALWARRFRQDLYHRRAVLSLKLPPLRERSVEETFRVGKRASTPCLLRQQSRLVGGLLAWGSPRFINVAELAPLLTDPPADLIESCGDSLRKVLRNSPK